ncbi:uncharacterized protein EI97DRAFT_373367 [Westerdykella ornata]|uniref:Cytochrome P450 n=1 Tax=Westerdykella ornata TaxID=318751 RepID=A0A6A6JNP3_WESOR|nr:uncharacterized protein EI97DRAFT_373367 [Westerdykella ornata]KAF2278241.1 hypothetical protein EI97DRAFT_373367 [Westerdykella ornata]
MIEYFELPLHTQLLLPLGVAFLTVSLVVAYRLYLHPLSAFPGPQSWAASRLPWIRHTADGRMWRELEHLHEKHGPFVRIAPNELSVLSPAARSDIYTSRPILPKEPTSQTPPLNGANSLFTAVGDDHRFNDLFRAPFITDVRHLGSLAFVY